MMTEENNSSEQLDDLLASLRDGTMTNEQIAMLDMLLAEDKAARVTYLNYVQLCADLRNHHGTAPPVQPILLDNESEQTIKPSEATTSRFSRGFRRWGVLTGVVASALVVLGLFWLNNWQTNVPIETKPSLPKIAVITNTANAVWDDMPQLSRGNWLSSGRLKLTSGLVQIEFFHGAVVILEGPAEFELIGSQRAFLHRGKLRSYVPMPSRGFVIETPQRKLIDHGTEFGLAVSDDGLTEVHVFDGKVEMQGDRSEILIQGESKQFSGKSHSKVIPFNGKLFSGPAALAEKVNTQLLQRRKAWEILSTKLAKDPAALVYYAFEKQDDWGRTLKDVSTTPHDGAIVGSHWAEGRWQQKGALEFKRTTDRVRISVPGEFDSVTLMAWVRIEGLDQWLSALMLTDGFGQGDVHWQLSDKGEMILGIGDNNLAVNYFSPTILGADDLGRWVHLVTVYDHKNKQVMHYRDGELIKRQKILSPIKLKIGTAEIGNWTPGNFKHQPVRSLNGLIDEFAIFSRPFDDKEIQNIYRIGKPY